MSFGNWRSNIAFGVGLAALLLVVILVNEPGQPDYYQETAKEHPHHTLHNVPEARVPIIGTGQPFPRYPETNWKEWHEEQDLKSQRQMAYWAQYAGIAALLSIGVALAGVFLVKQTLEANREAVALAGVAAEHSKRSADAAEHALRGLERPYLFIEKIDPKGLGLRFPYDGDETKPAIAFTIVNYGKTPAILKSVAMRLQSNPDWPLRLPIANNKKYFTVVQPGKRMTHRSGDDFGEMDVEGSHPGQRFSGVEMARLVLQGAIHYEDPTGAHHIDRFCLRGNGDGESWTLEGGAKYNWRKTTYPKTKPDETDT